MRRVLEIVIGTKREKDEGWWGGDRERREGETKREWRGR